MAQRTCDIDGCERKHVARGLCQMHWKRQYGRRTRYPITCETCGVKWLSARPDGRFCSDECKGIAYQVEMRTHSQHLVPVTDDAFCLLPLDHSVHRYAARQHRARWWTEFVCGPCAWCGTPFTVGATLGASYCSARCSTKAARARRRAREHNTLNDWRWSDFVRIARKFNYRCAYCGIKPERLDPDHVVPLSRGGADAVNNLLPACSACNCDKRDLLLDEWATDRAARHLPERTTDVLDDPRYHHLTHAMLVSSAA